MGRHRNDATVKTVKSSLSGADSPHSEYDSEEGEKEASVPETWPNKATHMPMHRGVLWGSISVFISVLGAASMFPFMKAQRDALQCDTFCFGKLQSARSGLGLIGSALVGRISDRFGRKPALWIGICASLLSAIINYNTSSVQGMWIALVPSALLNQNYTVFKALFADYTKETGGLQSNDESERASTMGKLGMAVGISFMLGPALGVQFLSSYHDACLLAICATVVAAGCLAMLPTPKLKRIDSEANLSDLDITPENSWKGVYKFLYLPATQSKGAKLLFFVRFTMALAFNVFVTIWTDSLQSRFGFTPKDHAYFMGWIGLCFAASQGILARYLIKWCSCVSTSTSTSNSKEKKKEKEKEVVGEPDPTPLLLVCIAVLGAGRVVAMNTASLTVVYIVMALVIMSLGVVNTAMNSAVTRLADADEVGGLIGVIEAVESSAGLVGPTLGGLLFRQNPNFPLVCVVGLYGVVFVAVWNFYRGYVLEHNKKKSVYVQEKESDENDMDETGENKTTEKTEKEKKMQ